MVESLSGVTVSNVLRGAAESVIANESLLTQADQAIGDGDHGIGMARGFKAALAALDALGEAATPQSAFSVFGRAILSTAGGASGVEFGTLFQGVGRSLAGRARVDSESLVAAFDAGAAAVMARGGAKSGDKTMLDALLPAIRALSDSSPAGLKAAFAAAASAANDGAAATAEMLAGTGRAKMLGQRSLGHVDPGAMTMSFVFAGMASVLKTEAEQD